MRRGAALAIALALAPAGCGLNERERSPSGDRVLERARAQSAGPAAQAERVGARVGLTPDRRSYYVLWPADPRGRRAVVTLHGYSSTAFDEMRRWQADAQRRGLAVVSLHWRLGRGSGRSYSPPAIREQLRVILSAHGIEGAMLHGYSSAAPRVYGIAALDHPRRYELFVGNAGGAKPGFPMHEAVFGGGLGPRPLAGTRWILYCGARDPDPDITGCPTMRRTRGLIELRGGQVARLLVDPVSGHDGLFERPRNLRAVLDEFSRRDRGAGQRGK